jgi:YD repeat-containing protein
MIHTLSCPANPGTPYPWEGNVGGVNSGNGNKLLQFQIVQWVQRGGLPVSFYLSHNSQSTDNSELGAKFTFSYNIYLTAPGGGGGIGNLAIHWGDDQSYTFTNSANVFTPPTGIYDKLVLNVDNTLILTHPDQTQYHFTDNYCDTITDENSNQVVIARNAGHYVTSITDCTSRAITLGYNGSNEISSITDPLSRVWTLAYSGGNLASITYPELGATYYSTSFSYNMDSDITGITTPGSRTLSFTYNSDDSIATATDGCSNSTSYSYASGATTITDPNSHVVIEYYNNADQLSQVKDNSGYTYTPTYDAYNNVTSWVDQRGKTWSATFNGSGDNLTSVDPYSDTVTRTFNSNNKLLTVTQPTGESVMLTRDGSDNITAVAHKNSGGTTEATETMTYSASGLLETKTNSNSNETQYGSSANGDLTSVTTPLGEETQFGVDGIGTRTSRTDAESRETTYSLDAWERCTLTTYPDSSTHSFAFDADSNLSSFVDATGTTYRYYDGDSRLTSETKGGNTVVAYGYDASGKKGLLSTVTDSNSRVITRSYDGLNRLSEVSETAGNTYYSYDACSNEVGETLPNGATVARVFDNDGDLTSITNSSVISGITTTLTSFSYVLDSDSRRTSCTEYSGDVVSWGYDWGSRLTSESRTGASAYSTTYTLDGEGRRTSQGVTVGGNTATTAFTLNDDDELTSTSSSTGGFTNSCSYSDNGEQIGRVLSGTTYSQDFDYDGQMTSTTGDQQPPTQRMRLAAA